MGKEVDKEMKKTSREFANRIVDKICNICKADMERAAESIAEILNDFKDADQAQVLSTALNMMK